MKALKELLKDFNEKINYNVFSLDEKQKDAIKRYAKRKAKRKAIASGNDNINNFMLALGRFYFVLRFRSCGGSDFVVVQRIWR